MEVGCPKMLLWECGMRWKWVAPRCCHENVGWDGSGLPQDVAMRMWDEMEVGCPKMLLWECGMRWKWVAPRCCAMRWKWVAPRCCHENVAWDGSGLPQAVAMNLGWDGTGLPQDVAMNLGWEWIISQLHKLSSKQQLCEKRLPHCLHISFPTVTTKPTHLKHNLEMSTSMSYE
jgi:hypothetical protein